MAGVIAQIDDLGNKITADLNSVRSSRTLKINISISLTYLAL